MLSAPAGYGKTSLLIDMADHSELPCCWLALDELDRDPQRFSAYFIAAIAERFPKFGTLSTEILEKMNAFDQDMERLLVTLVNEMYEQVHEHFIFVLDDFHLLEGIQPIQNFINRFIQLVDENCHLIISLRILTSLYDLPLLVAREQVSGLGFADLAFQPDEVQALLAQNDHLRITDEEAIKLIAETEGWITGLQFSGSGLLRGHSMRPALNTGIGLFDYLGQQVMDRQSESVREFLLRTSLMDEFDASLCESVLAPLYPQPQDWQNWIKTISRNNLFALPVGADGRWLRYHHLFRDYLRDRFERDCPEEVMPILFRLGQAYEGMGEWEKAHYVCKQQNDMTLLAEMIERASTTMLQRAHLTMESWLNDLPPSMLRTRPGLLSIRGAITYMKGDLRLGLNLLDQSEQAFRRIGNVPGLILALVRRATANRFLGDYPASLRDAEEVIQKTEASDDLQMFHAEALRVKGLALYRLGQARQAVEILEHSSNLYFRLNDVSSIPVLLMETGMAYRAVGNYIDANTAYEKALQIWRQDGNLSWQASLLNNMGGLYQAQGEYEKAALYFEEGLLCAQRSHYLRLDALISISLGDLYSELEDIEVADLNYQHAADVIREMEDRFLKQSLAMARVNLALLQGDAKAARRLLGAMTGFKSSNQSHYEQGHSNLLDGRIRLLEAKASDAIPRFKEARDHFLEDGRALEKDMAQLWLAAAYCEAGTREESAGAINSLLEGRGPIAHAHLVCVHQARDWLEGLQKDPNVGRLVRDLFARADRFSAKFPAIRRHLRRQARVIQPPVPHLIIRAFGRATVNVGSRELTVSDWQTQSVRDLFFFFLAMSKPMTKEQIGETIWPGVYEPSRLKLRFKNEIYRLRRAVGQDVILFKDTVYSLNRDLDYEYDVEAFETYVANAKLAGGPREQIVLYQKAVDLVAGPYLNDIYADWAIPDRERLGQMYLTSLAALADLYQSNAQPEEAISTCQRAIDYDPAFEAAYRIAMQAYSRLGDRSSITRMYQSCSDTLKNLFDLPPSNETQELHRRLSR